MTIKIKKIVTNSHMITFDEKKEILAEALRKGILQLKEVVDILEDWKRVSISIGNIEKQREIDQLIRYIVLYNLIVVQYNPQ